MFGAGGGTVVPGSYRTRSIPRSTPSWRRIPRPWIARKCDESIAQTDDCGPHCGVSRRDIWGASSLGVGFSSNAPSSLINPRLTVKPCSLRSPISALPKVGPGCQEVQILEHGRIRGTISFVLGCPDAWPTAYSVYSIASVLPGRRWPRVHLGEYIAARSRAPGRRRWLRRPVQRAATRRRALDGETTWRGRD